MALSWHVYELKSDIRLAGASTPTDRLADARRLPGGSKFYRVTTAPSKWAKYDRARKIGLLTRVSRPIAGYLWLACSWSSERKDGTWRNGIDHSLALSFLSLLHFLIFPFSLIWHSNVS